MGKIVIAKPEHSTDQRHALWPDSTTTARLNLLSLRRAA